MPTLAERLHLEFSRHTVQRYARALSAEFSRRQPIRYGWEKVTFNEDDHPRDDEGKFTSSGTSGHKSLKADDIYTVNDIENIGLYRSLVKDFRQNGWKGRPVLVVDIGDGRFQALTGSHRVIVAQEVGIEVPSMVIAGQMAKEAAELLFVGDEEKVAGLRKLGLDSEADLMEQENAVQHYSRRLSSEFARRSPHRYAKFVEIEHPRDEDGKFADGGGSSSTQSWSGVEWKSHTETSKTGKTRETKLATLPDGKPLPEHIAKLRIPPAWTNVRVNLHPAADLVATGVDAKGRKQAIYSANHATRQAALKFSRIRELQQKFSGILQENSQNRASNKEAADVTLLIATTGLRPGSERDTKAEKQAHGATTLLGRHVVIDGDNVRLEFVGKKGVDLSIPIHDPQVKAILRERMNRVGPNGKLFGITDGQLRDYVHSLDGGAFKPKDLRTHKGTSLAATEVREIKTLPKNEKEYKAIVRQIATKVSTALGNTPAIALQSYIDPTVFAKLRAA
jgi:DNA topoisomerase-1